jgi:hypothetical protein
MHTFPAPRRRIVGRRRCCGRARRPATSRPAQRFAAWEPQRDLAFAQVKRLDVDRGGARGERRGGSATRRSPNAACAGARGRPISPLLQAAAQQQSRSQKPRLR